MRRSGGGMMRITDVWEGCGGDDEDMGGQARQGAGGSQIDMVRTSDTRAGGGLGSGRWAVASAAGPTGGVWPAGHHLISSAGEEGQGEGSDEKG